MSDKLYKNRFLITFYEKDDDTLYNVYSNTREVTMDAGLPLTRENVIWISHKITRALRKKTHYTNIFGRLMKVYLVDVIDEQD